MENVKCDIIIVMLKTKLRKLKYHIKGLFFGERLVILAVIVAVLIWTYGAVSSMTRNWELEQALAKRRQELTILRLQVESMQYENEYFSSEEYQELAARAKQNKQFEGESLVYLPENSSQAKHKHDTDAVGGTTEVKPSNFSQWMEFLF